MSNWLVVILIWSSGAFTGALLALLMRNSGNISAEERAYTMGYRDGHRNGLRKGKVLKIDAALYDELKDRATGRVDVAPGNDSIRGSK